MEPRITLHGRKFKLLIPNAEIESAIDALADQMNRDFEGATEENAPILLCTLNGAMIFMGELLKRINFPCIVKAAKLSSYEGTHSTGVVKSETVLKGIEGRSVIVVEDIVDTGNTIEVMERMLFSLGAADVRICTLLLKPEVYKKSVILDYVAMRIPNKFIVGFGLDYDELGRNSKDIYVLDE
ncbi:MAG: hypoxanthine phosphoribosyltransferase [Bacteroidales bacterium]|nr:hypoxanthine phosphoribosyltransferase [Bacteroidales bacterium]